jgi:site-specific recombinase XerD
MTDLITLDKNGHIEINSEALKLENRSSEEKVYFLNRALEQNLTNQANKVLNASTVDLEAQINLWLGLKASEHTRRAYKKAINEWFDFLINFKTHPLLATAVHVDTYLKYMKDSKRPANTIRMKISACSSFHAYMVRLNEEVKNNPFYGADLPAKEYKKADNKEKNSPVMNEKELSTIEDRISEKIDGISGIRSCDIKSLRSTRLLSQAVHFMSKYGLRSGAIQTIRIEEVRFKYTTKGDKTRSRELREDTIFLLYGSHDQPFKGFGTSALQQGFKRITAELEADGEIREAFTCHDLRHYFAHKLFSATGDILQVSRALDHRSVNITQIYLQEELGF